MSRRYHATLSAVLCASLLTLFGCGGGGSSKDNGSDLPVVSIPPTVTLNAWAPPDAQLTQYTSYTFNASATDPNIGGAITEFDWDFGDGTTKVTPVVLANGKATTSYSYSYSTSGTYTLSVVAKNAAGLPSTPATNAITVLAAASPLTVSFSSPAAPITVNPAIGGNVTVTFAVQVVNTGTGTITASGVVLNPGDATATVGTPTDMGGGLWNIGVTYPGAAAIGSRTATPTIKVQDSNGISSAAVTGPVITINTVSAVDNPPVITLVAVPKIVAGTNATYQNVPITFTATATDPDGDTLTYTWTFGDGGVGDVTPTQAATALSQTHTYAAAGVYPVTFTASDGRGAVGIKSIQLNLNILANGPPTLSFVQAPAAPTYANVPITFTATVSDPNNDTVTLTWNFGDGSAPVIGTNPVTHSFAATGSTTVQATADDSKGGVTLATSTINVLQNRPPVASITTTVTNLFQNKPYTFTATATDPDSGDTITQYQWNFGDGTLIQTSATGTTSHTYASSFAGNASVSVCAVDNHGSTGNFSPSVVFPVLATSLPVGTFLNPPAAATYNTELLAAGVNVAYIVSMTNPNGAGFLPLAALIFNPGESAATATVLGAVANGDGTYTYQVQYKPAAAVGSRIVAPSITATDLQGISGLLKVGGPVTINTQAANNPPVVTFTSTSTPSAGTNASWQGVAFTFTGNATDADNDPMTYTIAFGDTGGAGDIGTTPVVAGGAITATHTYAAAGVYTAKLTVSDGRTNGTKTITLNMNVLANVAPVVALANNPAGTTQFANVPITFTATVTDANGDPTTLTWNFGDGTPVVTNQNPVTHTFTASGTTVVKATADDGKGGVTTASTTLTIQPNRPPVASITTPVANLFQNKAYTFAATATDPDAGDTIAQYQWNFGDGTAIQTSATGTLSHTYASSFTGNASVSVCAVDNHGSVGNFSPVVVFPVLATPLPVVTFTSPAATSLNLDLSPATVTQVFTLTATNPRAGSGATDPIPVGGITFLPNDPAASVTSSVSNGGGSYSFTVTYIGAAAAGTRTSTPTAYATDSLGIVGQPSSGPLMTLKTLGANHAPTITLTSPATDNTVAWTSKPFSLGFTLTDQDNDPVTYTVDWGDGSSTSSGTTSTSTTAGVAVTLPHTYADAFTATTQGVSIKVTATDNRSANNQAVAQTRLVTVTFNALPTATITTPQASGTAPTGLQAGINPPYVVVPMNGQLAFAGTSTPPGSGDPLLVANQVWTFPGGTPNTLTGDNPTGDVIFAGTQFVITPATVTYTVTDAFGRTATATKQVLVDGINTQLFNLSFQYRLKSDNNTNSSLTPVTTPGNGLGVAVQIFQDGLSNTYNVQNQAQLVGAHAVVQIPVRSDLPFYIEIPGFGTDPTNNSTNYLMRIPNAPTGVYADPDLAASAPVGSSTFSFSSSSAPWGPTLQIVTAQGFAAESLAAPQRKFNGFTDLVLGLTPINNRWLNRLSVPANDPTGAIQWPQTNNFAAQFSGIPAYQLFAEWPTLLLTRKTGDLAETVPDPTITAGLSTDLGFVLDYTKYSGDTQASETFSAFSMQAFRMPAGVTDPYQLSPAWQSATAELNSTSSNPHAGLNPLPVGGGVSTFLSNLIINTAPGGPLAGGIDSLPLPYDPNDPNRIPLVAPTPRGYSGIRQVFSYSEYLWSTVWAQPLVLNSARPNFGASILTFPYFRYSNPVAWPKASGISPGNSAFDLTASGGGVFDGSAPVVLNGPLPAQPLKGVGRFFWTAFTPSYQGDANSGAAIARTWLADDPSKQPPISFPAASATGDATVALGFMTPQDTIVDKRGRNADGSLSGSQLGGYRVTWYNPTKDASSNPVPPDFWVVELKDSNGTKHFMLPGSYPTGTQSVNDLIMTDARIYLPSGTTPGAGATVAPGYCWFDIPVELRPTGGATLTVFAVKSILKNHPVSGARVLNRPDWMDAAKTASATMKMITSSGSDLTYAYKIPFNFDWDIVVANGPQTPVAP